MRLMTSPLELMSKSVSVPRVTDGKSPMPLFLRVVDHVESAVAPMAVVVRSLLTDKYRLHRHVHLLVRWQFIPSRLDAEQLSIASSETTSTPSSTPLSSAVFLMPTH